MFGAVMGAFRWFSLLFVVWLTCGSAHAERRVALVIGNSAYKSVPRLTNPVNDATLIGGMLKKAGFDSVDIKLDLSVVDMRKALREFAGKTREAEVAVIYYAGHGIELDGNNYLIPTDAALETDNDVFDEAFPLDRVLFAIEPAKQLRLVILDACRDNPFAKTMKRTVAARAIGRGLGKVEPTSPNTMVAYAAKAGSTASDGDLEEQPVRGRAGRASAHTGTRLCARLSASCATMSSRPPATSRSRMSMARWAVTTCPSFRPSPSPRDRKPTLRTRSAGIMSWRCRSAPERFGRLSSPRMPTGSTPASPRGN